MGSQGLERADRGRGNGEENGGAWHQVWRERREDPEDQENKCNSAAGRGGG